MGTDLSKFHEPRIWDLMVQHVEAMLMENVAWSKEGDHVEQYILVFV